MGEAAPSNVVAFRARPRLAVRRLTLSDFRGYRLQRIETDGRPVVLTGANGAGKTNLLEAVSYLAPGRGLRRARLGEITRREPGADAPPDGRAWAVAARLIAPEGEVEIGTGLDPTPGAGETERRLVRIDGRTVKGQAELGHHASAVWLVPSMDRLFAEGPAGRRRFLDRLVYGFDPAHAGRLTAYEHALRDRARLLMDGRGDADWLSALEATMAEKAVAVAAARLDLVRRLDAACAEAQGPFPRPSVAVAGSVEEGLVAAPALTVEDRLRAALRQSRGSDAQHGGAGDGPHKSDLVVHDRDRRMPAAQGSTGEQKALLIALVLASARLQAAERGAPPLLLLDEVVAHLDENRRAALFATLLDTGAQAWLTGTDTALFAPLAGQAEFFTVRDACVARGS